MEIKDHKTIESIPRKEWEELWGQSKQATVYQTYDWYAAWQKSYGQYYNHHVLEVRHDNQLVGVCPLYKKIEGLPPVFTRRTLGFATSLSPLFPLYQGPLVDDELQNDVIECMALRIAEIDDVDAIHFEMFQRNSLAESLLDAIGRVLGKSPDIRYFGKSHVVCLGKDYETFFAALGSKTRRNIRSYSRKFFADNNNSIDRITTDDAFDQLIEELRTQKCQRMKELDKASSFEDEMFIEFLKIAGHYLLRDNRIYALIANVGGEIAGTKIVFLDDHGNAFEYNSSFDPNYNKMRLHYIFDSMQYEEAINRGCEYVDLSTGHGHHKELWTRGEHKELYSGSIVLKRVANERYRLYEMYKRVKSKIAGKLSMNK